MKSLKKRMLTLLTSMAFIVGMITAQTFQDANLTAFALQRSGDWMWNTASDDSAVVCDYLGSDENVTIPTLVFTGNSTETKKVTVIGAIDDSFQLNTSVKTVRIRSNLTGMICSPFCMWKGLTQFTVDDDSKFYCDIDGVLFNKDRTKLVCYPAGRKGDYIIPDGVTSISYGAFDGCSGLTSITIPESVTKIEKNAFMHCSSLQSVTLPDSVTEIEENAFRDCSALSTIRIGSGITTLPGVFKNCTSLTSVTIPDNVEAIGNAFEGCNNLISVKLPKNVTSLSGTFCGCTNLLSVELPDNMTKIGIKTFQNCKSLSSVSIPDHVTDIQESAFEGCSGLTSVTLHDELKMIGRYAFRKCSSLTDVTIPKTVTGIDIEAFSLCTNLTSITILSPSCIIADGYATISNEYSHSLVRYKYSGVIYGYANTGAQRYAQQCRYKFVSLGGDYEYEYKINSDGQTVTLTRYLGSDTEIVVPPSICGHPVTGIGTGLFKGKTKLTSVTIAEGITDIENEAFKGCTNLLSVSIPGSVNRIGYGAFQSCTRLYSITIPDSVTSIDSYAFSGTTWLQARQIENPLVIVSNILIDGTTCSGNVEIPDNVISINKFAFASCDSLTGIKIPYSVTSIGDYAFAGCANMTSITIPDSVTSIGGYTFTGCESLTIKGYSGSYAERYAKTWAVKYNIPFELLDEASTQPIGDVNMDGAFNIADVILLQKWLLAVPDTHLANWKAADFYDDHVLNVFDLCLMKRKLIYG